MGQTRRDPDRSAALSAIFDERRRAAICVHREARRSFRRIRTRRDSTSSNSKSFSRARGFLAEWPRTAKGRLATSGKTLERIARNVPDHRRTPPFLATVDLLEGIGSSFNEAGEIEEDEDKAKGLLIGANSRNHAALFPFGAKTSRNAPRGRAFLFTNPAWMRFLIRPEKGRAIAYLDWVAQELRIAAARSRDPALLALCERADPYIELAITLGLAPPGATKKSHPAARKIGKTLTLAMLYGAGPRMVAAKAKWAWRKRPICCAVNGRRSRCSTPGPTISPIAVSPPRRFGRRSDGGSGRSTGRTAIRRTAPAGIFRCNQPPPTSCRIAAIRAFEAGIAINAIVHDAFMIEASDEDIDQAVETKCGIMMRGHGRHSRGIYPG